MDEPWYHLDSGPGDPAWNMAVDEALLEHAAGLGCPVLRSYQWTVPAATFGYFQHHAEIAAFTALRPLLRRPTGGGLVTHGSDWTYSVIVPPGHPWHGLRAGASYERMHAWLRDAWCGLGVATHLAPDGNGAGPGRCFVGWEKSDLLWGDAKMGGAAQRRNRHGLLIQGSLQPVPEGVGRADFFRALQAVARRDWGAAWRGLPAGDWMARAAALDSEKYGRGEYHLRR